MKVIVTYVFALVLVIMAAAWIGTAVPDLASKAAAGVLAIGLALVGVLAVGYARFRLLSWWRSIPPRWELPTMAQFATTHALGPDLPDVQAVAFDELHSSGMESDWDKAITRFALVSRWGGYGWRSMCRYVGWNDWQACIAVLVGAHVLRPARGNIAAEWAPGWSFSRLRVEVKYGRLLPPYPTAPPPTVVIERSRTVTISGGHNGRTERTNARAVWPYLGPGG